MISARFTRLSAPRVLFSAFVWLYASNASATGTRDTERTRPDLEVPSLEPRGYFRTDISASWHSWGLVSKSELVWNRPFSIRDGIVWSHVELGGRFAISPAATRFGLLAEWMPAAFLQMRLNYDAYIYHGVYGYLLTFDSPDEPHSEEDIFRHAGDERPGSGQRVWQMIVLRGATGALLLRNQLDLVGYFVHTDAPWFYNWEYETLTRPNDFVLGNRTQLLVNALHGQAQRNLYIGPFYSVSYVPSSSVRTQRAGLDVYSEPFGHTRKMGLPRLLAVFGINIEETYRTRELFLVLGIGSTWQL